MIIEKPSLLGRMVIYITLSIISVTTIFLSFFVVTAFRGMTKNDDRLDAVEHRVAIAEQRIKSREDVSALYVPRFERVEKDVEELIKVLKPALEPIKPPQGEQ